MLTVRLRLMNRLAPPGISWVGSSLEGSRKRIIAIMQAGKPPNSMARQSFGEIVFMIESFRKNGALSCRDRRLVDESLQAGTDDRRDMKKT